MFFYIYTWCSEVADLSIISTRVPHRSEIILNGLIPAMIQLTPPLKKRKENLLQLFTYLLHLSTRVNEGKETRK